MTRTSRGIVAGFTATLVLSAVILAARAWVDLVPAYNPVRVLTVMAVGEPTPWLGWLLHFLIGTLLWGVLFALLAPWLPGPYWLRGVLFATGACFLMLGSMVPLAWLSSALSGALSAAVAPTRGVALPDVGRLTLPFATLILHAIYGVVLGGVYGWLLSRHRLGRARFRAPARRPRARR